ncbi:MAG: hypothetical protein JST84_32035 [Acidobacteria bacterium]|nr:hypothetical protein [Acidobacteriota bacterium]MBS1812841.1 hypothetical protein [Acidobacteriota bacterium]
MKTIELQLDRSYYTRLAIMGAMTGFPAFGLGYMAITVPVLPLLLFAILPLGLWGGVTLLEYRRGAKALDEEGVTRRDGKRFLWDDLQKIKLVYMPLKYGKGALNHAELHFSTGQSRIFPRIVDRGWEAILWAKRMEVERKAAAQSSAAAPEAQKRKTFDLCSICSQLKEVEFGFQKHGREDENTFLPDVSKSLQFVHDIKPGQTRSPSLLQCSECDTYYLYEIEYEYLATGSEDGQRLTRLTANDALQYL